MQVMWMVLITLVLALSGVLGLALRQPCCRLDQAPGIPPPTRQPHCLLMSGGAGVAAPAS